jgi:flagellar M-ring protein FliF
MAETGKAPEAKRASEQALAVLARGQKVFKAMPPRKRNGFLAGAVLLAAVTAALVWWLNRPDWRVLYSGMETRDAASVAQELGAAGIVFRMTSDQSGVEVPADQLDKARMEVASKGMPQTGRMGFELFDKPNWVGSEFDEKVNYQRALEGELEHTIASLAAVKTARVHLVMPAESLFSQNDKIAKASVVLKLRRPQLEPEQAESIRRLVAGAVEHLSPEDVTLVDADGRLDLQGKDQKQHESDAAQALEAKLVAMLEPTVGVGNVRAIVNEDYDEAAEDRTDEVYDPSLTATLSLQKSEQESNPAAKPSGVPGTASNTPAAAPPGAVQGSAAAAAPGVPPLLQASPKDALPVYPDRGFGQNQSMKEESGTYAVTKHTVHREDGPGRLKRITVAVLVNDRMTTEGTGKQTHVVWKQRTPDEMHRLQELAQAAVGFDAKRGDEVVVENVGFSSNTPPPQPAGVQRVVEEVQHAVQEDPWTARLAMMIFVALLLILLVLRPVAKQLVLALKEPKPVAPPRIAVAAPSPADALKLQQEAAARELNEIEEEKIVVEKVSNEIKQKPNQSTRLLEQWIEGPQD